MAAQPDAPQTLGDWIRRRRRALDLTQEALAERLGYAAPTLQKVERGERRPSRELAERLADALSVPAAEREAFLRVARAEPAAAPPAAAPEPARPARPPLPPPPAPLLGRDAEIAAVWAQLCGPDVRLVTLTGPGGAGKSALALHIAARAAHGDEGRAAFPDGAALVALGGAPAEADLARAVAAAIGAGDTEAQLVGALAGARLLLVLDDLEHLLRPGAGDELAALLGRILAEAPGVRVLATSRERLRLREEWVLELGGLAVPRASEPRGAPPAPSVELFVQRARRVAPGFAPDQAQRESIAALCRRLEGLPLAIELAASWCRALSPAEIAAEIDRALDFLASAGRGPAGRHQSMRATLDHSWRLLSPSEQRTLARLSVFAGGFDREAAAAVAGAGLPALAALIDKSLVRRLPSGAATRYALHELVRQYAAERLAGDPAALAAAQAAHTGHYAGLLRRAIRPEAGGLTAEGQARAAGELENLRAAWDLALAAGDYATLAAMARGLWLLYEGSGRVRDGGELFARAAESLRGRPGAEHVRGLALGLQGYYHTRAGQWPLARRVLAEGLALVEAAPGAEGLAMLVLNLGIAEHRSGDLAAAARLFARAGELGAAGDPYVAAWAEMHAGLVDVDAGDYAAAERRLERFAAAWRGQGYTVDVGAGMVALANTARLAGRHAEAAARARAAMYAAAGARDRFVVGLSLGVLGALAAEAGDVEEAGYLLAEGADVMRALGDGWHLGRLLAPQMQLEAGRDPAAARALGAELLGLVRQGAGLLAAEVCLGLALLARREGRRHDAAALLDAVAGMPARADTRHRAAALRAALGAPPPPPADPAPPGPALLAWLEELCARSPAPAPPPLSPAPPAGWLPVPETGESLSPREVEVLRLLVAGASNPAIAEALTISRFTAKNHVARILQKLGVETRGQAAARGRTLGLAAAE